MGHHLSMTVATIYNVLLIWVEESCKQHYKVAYRRIVQIFTPKKTQEALYLFRIGKILVFT